MISRLRKAVITLLVTGDIDAWSFWHVCPGCCESFEDALEKCLDVLLAVLLGRVMRILQRRRWLGHAEALDFAGLLEGICHLLTQIYREFCGDKSRGRAAEADAAATAAPLRPSLLDGVSGPDVGGVSLDTVPEACSCAAA